MRRIAVIPARSGSKGLKDKNIKEMAGKPLMAYTIEAARLSGVFDEVMVSTDSEKYAEIARKYGAHVPFLRSEATSGDKASTWDTVREVIGNYKNLGEEFDVVAVLQPTSPLRTADDIKGGMELFDKNNASAVIGVCELEHSINICNTLGANNSMNGFFDSNVSGRRQDAGKYYRINGALYIQKVDALMNKENLYGEGSYAYVMDKKASIDVDDEMDFKMAEVLM
ncbi:MAG: acylneuraminate cytidylyltransferase family protein [Lachnospiraceae bacterium]|nr:acylneuraminate cytidylyltransferase family protein [Lachnospiraceae bacterium]MBR4795138.1 acylneuraminate cytidylyltransferase family protein [Lachnospiraceae bacterium]